MAALDQPTCSIVIPAYEQPQLLNACLEALSRLQYPRDRFEVIVVDDGSTPPLRDSISRWSDVMRLQILVQPNRGPASARNAGAAQATGEILAFTDHDCAPEPDWLDQFTTALATHPQALVGGETRNALDRNFYSEASQVLVSFLHDRRDLESCQPTFFASCNIAFQTARFREIGGFNPAMYVAGGEDREFCDRWRRSGRAMLDVPGARVQHYHALNLQTYCRQHFHYGRGAYLYRRLRAELSAEPLQVESLGFYLQLLTAGFGRTSWAQAIPVTALLGLAQVANAAGFLWEHSRSQLHGRKGNLEHTD